MVALSKIAQWVGMAVFLAAMYLLVQWVTISFAITHNGVIKWAEGWEETKCYWIDCDSP